MKKLVLLLVAVLTRTIRERTPDGNFAGMQAA